MSWRDWVRATAIRLGLNEPGSIPVETALNNLSVIESRLMALRTTLIQASAIRSLYVDEAIAYDVARGNVYAATHKLRENLISLGVPSTRLPATKILAPLPQSAIAGVRLASAPAALGAIRVGPGGADFSQIRGSDYAGTLGSPGIVVALGWAALAIGVIGAAAGLGYVLVDLVNPEVAIQQSIAEHDIAIAEATASMAREWEETRRTAIENGVDPNTLTPPDLLDLNELASGNPILGMSSSVKGIIWGVAALAGIFVGYKIWKSYS